MIKCDKGELTVRGKRFDVGAEGVAILAFLYQEGLLVGCLKTFDDMLHAGQIDKVFEEDEGQ